MILACLFGFARKGGRRVSVAEFPVHRCQVAVGDGHRCRGKKAGLDCLFHLLHTGLSQGNCPLRVADRPERDPHADKSLAVNADLVTG